jgi:5-methylcytosine-specific restriction enzyme A
MAAITEDQVRRCYDAARSVLDGAWGHTEAVQTVIAATGLNPASAADYVSNIRFLIQPTGRVYARTMKISETERILGWIARDYGPDAARLAAQEVLRHVDYYAQLPTGGNQPTLRAMAQTFLAGLAPTTLTAMTAQEAVAVDAALRSPRAERQARLAAADPKPRQTTVSVKVYLRNPDVVAEVLDRAQGKCEACARPAPFVRFSTGLPYLEVHHRTPLAEDGDDHPDNALALCPNCHREAHHGQDRARFLILQPE